MKKKHFILVAFLIGLLFASFTPQEQKNKEVSFFQMNGEELNRPVDYRSWVYVGTPLTPNDLNNGKAAFPEFHNVYIDPVIFKYWKENGAFRDGTILVKELISVGTKQAVSGNGYFMGDFIGLEATIKSAKHFPDEPGNWAYFSFTNPGKEELKNTTKKFDTNSCNSCHETSAADDFVFTQYYPVLSRSKGFGVGNPENSSERKMGKSMAVGSGMSDIWKPTAETPENVDSNVPVDKDKLFVYLKNMEYQKFKNQETGMHPSLGPHTKEGLPVKVFMNDKMAKSMANSNGEHPLGAAIVKEMYSEQKELSGWAVMVKTQDVTNNGKGWFWYEVTSITDGNKIAAIGNGVIGCINCHNLNDKDLVRTAFPLK